MGTAGAAQQLSRSRSLTCRPPDTPHRRHPEEPVRAPNVSDASSATLLELGTCR